MSEAATKVKVFYEGESVDAEEMRFAISEAVVECAVDDGSRIHIKYAVKGVYRLCEKKRPNGKPVYVIMGKMDTTITDPE